jgi:Ca-activated chloride channel family protein
MRRRTSVVALAVIAVVATSCSASATQAPQYQPPDHHNRYTPPPIVYPRITPAPAPYDATTFTDPGVNPYVDASQDNQSTFALDVDTASYTVARRFITDGNLPDPASVRVEEWVNYFDQGYAPPEDGVFAIYADGAPTPYLTRDEVLLRVGVKAVEVSRHERPPAALTFVIDTSGSMAREDRLDLVKQSLNLLVDQMRPDDTVAIVAFSTEARVILGPTRGSARDTIRRAIDVLQPENTTNAEAGLRLGYGLAREQFLEGGINRVVLASDGVANVGSTDPESILQEVRSDASNGIQLVSVGVGMGNYNDTLLEQLADQGDGFYAYIDTLDEARRLFVQDLVQTLHTVALDARAQVEFNPDVVAAYRLIGYENRAVPDQDFRNNSVAAGAIGSGHSVTALYGLRLRDGIRPDDRIATVNLRWTDPATSRAAEIARDVNGDDLDRDFASADEHFKLDALVAAAAEVFRGSPWIEGYRVRDLVEATGEIVNDLPRTSQVADFLDLLDQAARIER